MSKSISITQRVKQAKELSDKLAKLNSVAAQVFWQKAELLASLKKNNLYRFRFGDDGSKEPWSTFLRSPEIAVPRSSAEQKIVCHNFFIEKHGFGPTELGTIGSDGTFVFYDTNCMYYLSRCKENETKQVIEEWMSKIPMLSREDFIDEIRGYNCIHEHTHEVHKEEKNDVCDDCGRRVGKSSVKLNKLNI